MRFSQLVMDENWPDVIEKFEEDSYFHKIEIKGRGTALHVAVSSGLKEVVKCLVKEIIKHLDETSLRMINERGATPLHLAANAGYKDMCELIIGRDGERKYLIQVENENGETPLFWAVQERQTIVFLYLRQFYPTDFSIAINRNNTSILHVAIQREMFDLAIIIIYSYESLSSLKDKDGATPLKTLATKTSAFKSGSRLSWWKLILYYCYPIRKLDAETTMKELSKEYANNEKEDYCEVTLYIGDELEKTYTKRRSLAQSCHHILKLVLRWPIMSLLGLEEIKAIKEKHIYGGQLLKEFMKEPYGSYMGGGETPYADKNYDCEINDDSKHFQEFIKVARGVGDASMDNTKEDSPNMDVKDTTFLAAAKSGIKEIMEELNAKVSITSDQKGLLLIAMKNIKTELSEEENVLKDTAYLIAASFGIIEMMRALKSNIRSVILETNSNNENALLLGVKNRQPLVIQFLLNSLSKGDFGILNLQIDKNENTMLHLAAYTSFQSKNTWRLSGAAMQLTWDIKWYQYIKELVPEHFSNKDNKERKTPSEIFKEEHKELLQKSVDWLKDTTQSYSVVAALIAGVAFATSSNIPGGNKPTGEPTLKGQPAFEGFAISSLIGLYFSVTALIIFLSILTSPKELEEFRLNLPMKLLFGLISLFVSVVAMLVSFCAGHFFVLTDEYTKGSILFYLYISIFLPVTYYAAIQFQLFVDLVNVIWKKVPPPSVKGVLL
ncbi:hypothetical protein RYX36_016518 [Vicia faba]